MEQARNRSTAISVATTAGMVVRRQGDQWLGILRCGAATPEEARSLADGYMARRAIVCEWAKTEGGQRLKVGIAGFRRYDVVYRLAQKP